MKMLDIIDREDLKNDYKKTDAWIKRYGRMAGGYGKPMTWIRSEFEEFDIKQRQADRNARAEELRKKLKIEAQLNQIVRSIATAPSVRTQQKEMRGKGGRACV